MFFFRLDTLSVDLDTSPKTLKRRRAPAPPPPVVIPPETTQPPTASQLPLSTAAATAAVQTPVQPVHGHRRMPSANAPITPGAVERPNIPPPAPPRPKPHVNSADETGRTDAKTHDATDVDDQSAKQSQVLAQFDSAVGETSADGALEEKAVKTADLRAQWFQSNTLPKENPPKVADHVGPGNYATVRRTNVQSQFVFDAESGAAQPVKEPRSSGASAAAAVVDADGTSSTQKAPEIPSAVGGSIEASAVQSVDRHAELSSSAQDSHRAKSPETVANGDPRPKPMARSRLPPPQVQSAAPVNHGIDETTSTVAGRPSVSSTSDGSFEIESRKKSGVEAVDIKKADARPVSGVRRPPPPIIPRQTSRQTSDGCGAEGDGGKTTASLVAAAPATEDVYEEEDADTRL